MNGTRSARATPATHSAILSACSSLSMTHGPAIRNSSPQPIFTLPTWKEFNTGFTFHVSRFRGVSGATCNVKPRNVKPLGPRRPQKLLHLRRMLRLLARTSVLMGRLDKRREQRMRLQRLRLELGMELAAQEVRMVRDLHNLHVRPIRRRPRDLQPRGGQRLFVLAVELVTVPMTFADLLRAISLRRQRSRLQLARPRAQAHGSAQLLHSAQLAQLVDHPVRR